MLRPAATRRRPAVQQRAPAVRKPWRRPAAACDKSTRPRGRLAKTSLHRAERGHAGRHFAAPPRLRPAPQNRRSLALQERHRQRMPGDVFLPNCPTFLLVAGVPGLRRACAGRCGADSAMRRNGIPVDCSERAVAMGIRFQGWQASGQVSTRGRSWTLAREPVSYRSREPKVEGRSSKRRRKRVRRFLWRKIESSRYSSLRLLCVAASVTRITGAIAGGRRQGGADAECEGVGYVDEEPAPPPRPSCRSRKGLGGCRPSSTCGSIRSRAS